MPFTTGTAVSPSDLMSQIDTFITANGWTRLRGDPDLVPASPKAARYWRILMTEQEVTTNDFFELENVELRETLGGANLATNPSNWSASSTNTGTSPGNLTGGTAVWQSQDVDDAGFAWVKYDFGSPQVIRQLVMQCDTDDQAPTRWHLQWSNDDQTWTTMEERLETELWVDNEIKVFDFDDGFVLDRHVSATVKRANGQRTQVIGDGRREDDTFVWQGPGYDAARRVFIGMRSSFDLTVNTHRLELYGMADWVNEFDINQEVGGDTVETPRLLFTSGTVEYWVYVNSIRLVVICKNDASDYTSAYLGFGAAFAQPDDWGFPLLVIGTSDDDGSLVDTNNALSSCADPGNSGQGRIRLWDNTWQSIQNRATTSVQGLMDFSPEIWIHPYHMGRGTGDSQWPFGTVGDNDSAGSHILDALEPTEQGDLPMFSCVVQHYIYGNMCALDGIFAAPGGGTLTPEQVINIGGQDYRVFPNRQRRDGNDFFAVRED